MCCFIRPPASQVIQQRRDRTGKENEDRTQDRSESPIEPGDADHKGRLLLELAEHLRPEVAAELGVLHGGDCCLGERFDFFAVFFIWHFASASSTTESSFLRKIRTARNPRLLTSAGGVPIPSSDR